jgi:ABC-type uncharacterized transport system ATPase subunit
MQFRVVKNSDHTPNQGRNIGYLWTDNWNDWFKYRTLFTLTYFDAAGERHELGYVKIGQFGMERDQSRPALPNTFETLDDRFFSLGQDAEYYTSAMALGADTGMQLLTALRDIASDADLYARALNEDVTGTSLLRSVNITTVEGQFRRIINGGAALTNYSFRYRGPTPRAKNIDPLQLHFEVTPDSRPPTNIHVLIGRNGVGKTYLLNGMTRALVSSDEDSAQDGAFTVVDMFNDENAGSPFANIVSVTFSAFDDFQVLRQKRNATHGIRYTNIGLRKRIKDKNNEWVVITQDPEELAKEFSLSAKLCSRGVKLDRWRSALTTLEADPLFAEAEVAGLAEVEDEGFGRAAGALYRRLSSGHKIVLLTLTKLVETVEERTLVLMDEPEAHLHPPLLSAFVRALSDLLINRNGVAIIATHSPVVLQEVPASCVWKIIRHGEATEATRPEIETFAEAVGILTREVFGLEVTRSGFHKMLGDAVEGETELDVVLQKFDNEVGAEGRALLSSMLAVRRADGAE